MRHPTDDELSDLHDGLLTPAERAGLEAHLVECTVCEDRSAALGELLDQLHGVPRAIAPPEEVWTSVRSRIQELPVAAATPDVVPLDARRPAAPVADESIVGHRGRVMPRWLLAAAAMLLVVVSAALAMRLIRRPSASPADLVATSIASEASLARFAELEAAYLRAAADLVDALERERRSIPPDVAERARQSLLVIDEAVQETRAALANDPDNTALAELTLAAHRRKLEFLQRVRQWSTES